MLKWITFAVGGIGLAVGLFAALTNSPKVEAPAPARPPSVNPFENGVAASGIVEAASRNIAIGPPEAGLVVEVYVDVNDRVQKDQPLLKLDTRTVEAELVRGGAVRAVAAANLAKLKAQPRPEDLPPLRADVAKAEAIVNDARAQLERVREAIRRGAGSPDEESRKGFALDAAEASLSAARAELARAEAGAWAEEIRVAEANLAQAEADIAAWQIRRDRLTVRSPINGVVLKRNVEPGTYAQATRDAAMVVGDLSRLRVRTQVDEEDAPLVRPGARAAARLRGAVASEMSLRMVRIEPLASPKMLITGDERERVDTRVIEVLLDIEDPGSLPVYPGQMVDVFIEAAQRRPTEGESAGRPANGHSK